MGALAYLNDCSIPRLEVKAHKRPLIVGSGNALQAGKILFRDVDATFVEEGGFDTAIARGHYDAVYIVSASGSKHAGMLAHHALTSGIPAYLITNTSDSPAERTLGSHNTFVYPRIREPYTYNTSTYLAMLYGNEVVKPHRVETYIETVIEPLIPDFSAYRAFLLVLPPEFTEVRTMYETKFDELFGPQILGRATTTEGLKHAKTVITSNEQCFVSFGGEVTYGAPGMKLTIPLPDDVTYPEMIAIGYYVIGRIQKAHHPYFKERISAYVQETSAMFGQTIPVIIE
jgi:hypothetical protein